MSLIHRIGTDHRVEALVAFDSFPLIADRIERLTTVGRGLTIAHRYATYTGQPPEIYAGLTVYRVRVNLDTHSLWVECDGPDDTGMGFGIGIRDRYTAGTEDKAWSHYRAGRHEADRFSDRRRDLTWVRITGGRRNDDPDRSDEIVVRTYNGDGVCDERVIKFDRA